MTDEATEMPRCFSISIQSDVAWREALRPFTAPAIWIEPENSSSFSVSVVLPASGWEMMAKVRRRRVSAAKGEADTGGREFLGEGTDAVQSVAANTVLSPMGVPCTDGEGIGRNGARGGGQGRGRNPSGQAAVSRGGPDQARPGAV